MDCWTGGSLRGVIRGTTKLFSVNTRIRVQCICIWRIKKVEVWQNMIR